MTWKETGQKGVFSRRIDENEIFIKLMGDSGLPLNREHWAINSTATIVPTGSLASTDLIAHFRRAWAHLRFQEPSIAAEVAPDDTNLIYTVPADGAALDAWVSQTFIVSGANSAADVIVDFRPSPYAKLVYLPKSGELLGHTTHWRSDGYGVMMLLDAFLTIASAPSPLPDPALLAWGTEISRLAPSIEEAAAVPKESTPEAKKVATALVSTFAHAAGMIGIPYLGDSATLPAGTRSATLVLSPAVTSKVVTACKERGMSVTSAVHASAAGANYALADETTRNRHYTSTVRFALRPYLLEPYTKSSPAAGMYTTGWLQRVEASSSWAERARAYHNVYRKGISRDFFAAYREGAAGLIEMVRNSSVALGAEDSPPSNVEISSIGIAEKLIKREYGTSETGFEVTAVSLGVELLARQATVFVWTFRDRLNFHLVYNEAYHSAEQMNRCVGLVKELLLEGLGV